MLEPERLERAVAGAGLASPAKLAHARALQLRGRSRSSLGALLVELEHARASDVAAFVRSLPGADEDDIAAATGVVQPVGLEADDLGALLQKVARDARATPPRTAPEELRWREENERAAVEDDEDPPFVRIANLLLLRWLGVPGQCVRLELDAPRVRTGHEGKFDVGLELARANVVLMLMWRFKEMAGVAPGPGERRGLIRLWTRRAAADYFFDLRRTERGDVVLLRRGLPWSGSHWPEGDAWSAWRAHMIDAHARRDANDLEGHRAALARALDAARAAGDHAFLEHLTTAIDLGWVLIHAGDGAAARAVGEEAIAIAKQRELGPRAEAELSAMVALAREEEPGVALPAAHAAIDALSAVGVGRMPWGWLSDLAWNERLAGRAADAIATAERVHADAAEWFGAATSEAYGAWTAAVHAHLDVGDTHRARALTTRQHALGRALSAPDADAIAWWHEGRALMVEGFPDRAVPMLRTAHEAYLASSPESPEGLPYMQADLAVALARLGHSSEAQSIAARVFPRLQGVAQREVQQLLGRGGPFR